MAPKAGQCQDCQDHSCASCMAVSYMTTWKAYCNNISLGVGIGIGIIYCYLMLLALLSSIELLFGLDTSSFYIKIMKHLEQEAVATLLQSLHGAGVAAKAIQILAIWSNDIDDLTDLTSMYLYTTACCRKTAHWMLNTIIETLTVGLASGPAASDSSWSFCTP